MSNHHLRHHYQPPLKLSEPPRKRSRDQSTASNSTCTSSTMMGDNGSANNDQDNSATSNQKMQQQQQHLNNQQHTTQSSSTLSTSLSSCVDVEQNSTTTITSTLGIATSNSRNLTSNLTDATSSSVDKNPANLTTSWSNSSASSLSAGPASSSSTLNVNPITIPQSASRANSNNLSSSSLNPSTSQADVDSTTTSHASNKINPILSFSAVPMVARDNDPDEIEISRLQAILEARGVPSHLLGALGPRVQTHLHRIIGSSSSSKAHQLVQGIQARGDEGQQLQSVMEMCQLLVMGNEDTLAGFPIKLAVPNLIQLLNMEHNFDIMNHACRALTYMMESLPRSASVVVDAVPSFLEKLQSIQCMDVAEQSLTALEMLSKRHSRAILQANGISACLTFLDFFSINAQRSALTITANCCQNLTQEEFTYIKDSLSTLSSHLTSTDKKSVESICLAFSRIVEQYQNEPDILMDVAGSNLLENLGQLLLTSPSIISMQTFVMIIRMMALICQNCPELAVRLLSSDVVSTIKYLLVGQKSNKSPSKTHHSDSNKNRLDSSSLSRLSTENSTMHLNESVELLNRSPQELYEITSLIAELMPRLPHDGIFSVDSLLSQELSVGTETTIWQWRDDRGIWHRYSTSDNKVIDSAHRLGDEDVSLVTMGKTYIIDFTTMQQINEETDISRPIRRKYNFQSGPINHNTVKPNPTGNNSQNSIKDPRIAFFKSNPKVLENFGRSLFHVLYEIYGSSAGPSVRHKCLCALLRITYYTQTSALKTLLKIHPVSSHIAAMLVSSDSRILVGSIQMSLILMERLPDVFSVYFRREGVMHQLSKLANQSSSPRSSSSTKSNKEKVREWVVAQAQLFREKFLLQPEQEIPSCDSSIQDHHPAMDTLNKLTRALDMLDKDETMFTALNQLKSVISEGDITSFELIHSGMVSKLTKFLTHIDTEICDSYSIRDRRIRAFLSVFMNLPSNPNSFLIFQNEKELSMNPSPFAALVNKLNACISQLEQFPVRVHDFIEAGSGNNRGTSALKFFNTHQLKCNLQRHPLCSDLRQWRGGLVKIDPLAVVQAIEKYLTVRGYAKVRDCNENSDDNNSDDDMEDSMNIVIPSSGRYRLQLLIGEQVLPSNMTVYQAIRQYGSRSSGNDNGLDIDEDIQFVGNSNIWSETHTIYYRPFVESASSSSINQDNLNILDNQHTYVKHPNLATTVSTSVPSDLRLNLVNCGQTNSSSNNNDANAPANSSTSTSRRQSARISANSIYSSKNHHRSYVSRKKVDDLWSEGKTPTVTSPVDPYLQSKFPVSMVNDPSLDIIVLLKAIYGINRYWTWFYRNHITFKAGPAISSNEFINNKLSAKATRQLQDPLVIMTANLPDWLPQIAYNCPFLIPFETRQLLFYVVCFDRDRALQRLLDRSPEYTTSEDRVTPRLDRRKKTINRENIFKQAEIVLGEMANSKTVLEIQYENEVGTGLGPTLEFYALMSRELQSADLEMWRGDVVSATKPLLSHIDTIASIKDEKETEPIASGSYMKGNCPDNIGYVTSDRLTTRTNSTYANVPSKINYKESRISKVSQSIKQKYNSFQLSTHINPTRQPDIIKVQEVKKRYMFSPNGLFPQPIARNAKIGSVTKLRTRYKLLGRFMARALMDSRMIDISFSLPFYKWLLSMESSLDLTDMVDIDPTMARTLFHLQRIAQLKNIINNNQGNKKVTAIKSMDKLKQLVENSLSENNDASCEAIFKCISPEVLTLDGCPIEDLNLDFTLPGYSAIELRKGGKDTVTTLDNLEQYISLLRHWTLTEGVKRQMESFKAGFENVIPLSHLRLFYPEELDSLFCGSGYQSWDIGMLMDACKTDHGFTHESIQIKFLFEILSSYNADEQRRFLQFITGSPRLPYGGLKSLSPPLTIVRKTLEHGQNPDHFLPSVMTCVNYLKLPEYSSIEIMREKMRLSGEEGCNYFHLS